MPVAGAEDRRMGDGAEVEDTGDAADGFGAQHHPASAHAGSERVVDLRGQGRTAQLSPSSRPRSTGLRRRFARRRGDRLWAEPRGFL